MRTFKDMWHRLKKISKCLSYYPASIVTAQRKFEELSHPPSDLSSLPSVYLRDSLGRIWWLLYSDCVSPCNTLWLHRHYWKSQQLMNAGFSLVLKSPDFCRLKNQALKSPEIGDFDCAPLRGACTASRSGRGEGSSRAMLATARPSCSDLCAVCRIYWC